MDNARPTQKALLQRGKGSGVFVMLLILAALFLIPLFIILINSFKGQFYIRNTPFSLPTAETYVGLRNYIDGIKSSNFFRALINSLFVTVVSVALILLGSSMTAWFLVRVRSTLSRLLYYMFVFSMIVPFQMVMYTMTYVVTKVGLNTVPGITLVYLGFGAGLSVFMFTGFIRSIPLEIEEAAMIDGCNSIQTFFLIVFPMLKPTTITVAILNAMWIWNDYLLPYLILGSGDKKTIPVAIQMTMQGAYGNINYGGFMATLVLTIIPIVIFYFACQKYIIKGVISGAVKG